MTTRKAPIIDGENTTKRRRLFESEQVDDVTAATNIIASFDHLNQDCLVIILSYLQAQDMNNVAMVNRSCREARSNESLDQTRSGTIVCSEQSSIRSILNAIVAGGGNAAFSGHRTHLRIQNFASVASDYSVNGVEISRAQLSGVTSLDLSYRAESPGEIRSYSSINVLLQVLPNLREIDFSHLEVTRERGGRILEVGKHCPHLTRITASFSGKCMFMSGCGLCTGVRNLTELYLDGSRLLTVSDGLEYESPTAEDAGDFLLEFGSSLERVGIKGTTWGNCFLDRIDFHAITQNMLMKMVRNHANLRWLRSDLSEENVEILKRERPEITFVSE